jgi:light-regulated signal transduction histidine kinase (bacteriophytochrome)
MAPAPAILDTTRLHAQVTALEQLLEVHEESVLVQSAALETALKVQQEQARGLESLNARLRHSNADLEQFAFAASHDLQEPLRAIAGFSRLLQQLYAGRLDARADDYITHIVEAVERMYGLINDLLEYARVTRQGQSLQPTDFNRVVQNALALLKVALEESGTKVFCRGLPTIPADQGQMIRLFQNLIGNAIKYRSAQTPEVRIAAVEHANEFQFSVQDNGIGIDPQHFERIFVIFQRLHTREEYPGTGIGLAVCKRIVERHGGRIGVESTPGKGSTFSFTIGKYLGG